MPLFNQVQLTHIYVWRANETHTQKIVIRGATRVHVCVAPRGFGIGRCQRTGHVTCTTLSVELQLSLPNINDHGLMAAHISETHAINMKLHQLKHVHLIRAPCLLEQVLASSKRV